MPSEPMLIALDVDGTLFDGARVDPAALDALTAARADGHVLVIVTGRPWRDLPAIIPEVLALSALTVCEHGAVLVDPRTSATTHLSPPVASSIRDAVAATEAARMVVGDATIGLPADAIDLAEAVCARPASGCYVVANKSSIAIVPDGCDKGTGLTNAVVHLGLQDRRILAVGDATNDLPMFASADVAVAVANAEPALTATGIEVTAKPFGAGVAEALARHLLLSIA